MVLYTLHYFPADPDSHEAFIQVALVSVLHAFGVNAGFTASFAIIMQMADKRIAGMHITLLAAISNFTHYVHKFYIFSLVDYFGIFYPQILLTKIGLAFMLVVRNSVLELDNVKKEEWWVSKEVIGRKNQ